MRCCCLSTVLMKLTATVCRWNCLSSKNRLKALLGGTRNYDAGSGALLLAVIETETGCFRCCLSTRVDSVNED